MFREPAAYHCLAGSGGIAIIVIILGIDLKGALLDYRALALDAVEQAARVDTKLEDIGGVRATFATGEELVRALARDHKSVLERRGVNAVGGWIGSKSRIASDNERAQQNDRRDGTEDPCS